MRVAALTTFSPRAISVFAIILVNGSRACAFGRGVVAPQKCCHRAHDRTANVKRSVVVHDFHAVRARLGGHSVPLSQG